MAKIDQTSAGLHIGFRDPATGDVIFRINTDGTIACQGTSAKTLNNIRYADQFSGATADVQITNAVADLPAAGGIVDCRGYGASEVTIAAPVAVGTATKQVCLLLDIRTTYLVTITNGSAAFSVASGSAIVGKGIGGTSYPSGIVLASTANVLAAIANAATDATQEFFWLENLYIQGHPSATCPALVDVQAVYINSGMRNCVLDNFPAIGLHLRGASGAAVGGLGPFVVDNCWINGENVAGARPVVIETQGTNPPGEVTFIGCAIEHQGTGAGAKLVEIDGHGSFINGISFYNTYFENHNSPSANASSIGISVRDCDGFILDGCINGGLAGTDFVHISESNSVNNNNIILRGTRNFVYTNHVNDTVHSQLLANHYIGAYYYPNDNGDPSIWIGDASLKWIQTKQLYLSSAGNPATFAVENSTAANDYAYLGWAGDNKCRLHIGNNRVLAFNVSGADSWQIGDGSTGHLLTNGDNLYDIGVNGGNRPRAIYAHTFSSGATWTSGTGAPVGAVTIGSLYSRTDGGAGSSLYVYNGTTWTAVA